MYGDRALHSGLFSSLKNQSIINCRVSPTGFLQSDLDAKLKIDEF